MRRCLDETDVAEFAEVSADELERLITSAELMPTTPEAMLCHLDPSRSSGMTLDEARQALAENHEVIGQ
jgi:hypothetical protein